MSFQSSNIFFVCDYVQFSVFLSRKLLLNSPDLIL